MSTLAASLTGVAVAVAVIAVAWMYIRTASRKTRLRLLRIRVSVARGALLAALDRRVAVARLIGAELGDEQIVAAADAAALAEAGERELCENRLSTALSDGLARQGLEQDGLGQHGLGQDGSGQPDEVLDGAPGDLAAQLQDAQIRIMMARRFFNDAVRDTRTLRQRRLVRWLRLDKGAQRAEFFEIADSL